jgi:predicted molibdopterin-dependent oxidoreductase YjgC
MLNSYSRSNGCCYKCDKSQCGGFQVKGVTIFLRIFLWESMPKSMQGRLTQPLVCENGSHRPATWDEAMERVAAAFRKSIARKDPRNFGMFSCSKTTNELNYAAQKFARSVMGTNNIDSCNRT